jgi:DNA-binding response OmpR family regulator
MPTIIDGRISEHCSSHPHQPPRILCVDDDPGFQTTIEMRMRAYDVEIEHAFYGTQGIAEAINARPDLILLDLAMPSGDGKYLLECIKRNSATASIPVIVLTGMRDPNLTRRVLQAGAAVLLQKPVHFDELLHHISQFVDIRERQNYEGLR